MTMLPSILTRRPVLSPIDPCPSVIILGLAVMATEPRYPEYLPVRPEGFTPTLDIPPFAAEEPGLRADPELPELLSPKTILKNVTPRVALLPAQRGVLVFRDQEFADIGLERQLAIARHFGPLHKHPTMGYPKGPGPEFQVIYGDEKLGNLRDLLGPRTTYDLWHIDQTFTPNTPGLTFFWALEVPASGGEITAFTSLTAAYNALSPAFREGLHRLKLLHTSASVGEIARLGQERALKEAVKTEHPLVISHPVTKEPVLFVNPTIARQVVGYKPSESDFLLGFLHDHIRSLDFSCRVSWEKGTVVVWDQRTVAHSAVPDFKEGERRHMVRIIPYGSQPQPL
ncbi:hypothetical protein BDV11DRAFT_213746 [Aspergillus similis]